MPSPFDPQTGTWKIGWPGRVSRHDLVYLTPPTDPMQGLPIGNGEIGVLAWFEDSRLIFVVNKSDLWDDAKFGRFRNWHPEEEEFSTTLRHGCRIILDFKLPIFDTFYLKDFQARISLADARLSFSVAGPFGTAAGRGFIDHVTGTFCFEGQSRLKENVPLGIRLERFGSRTFSHWYASVNRNPELGLKGTRSAADKDGIYVTHKLTTGTFAAGCRVIRSDRLKIANTVEHSHTAKTILTGSAARRFTLLAAVTSPMAANPIPVAKKQLKSAETKGPAAMFRIHAQVWKEFWLRSLMESGDDYLDSLWHITMFYAACSQRGKYPGRFINGLWTWNRDVQNWNFYFHWNQQQIYWPLNAAGHHDLIESYLDYRFNSLPHACQDARAAFKTDGAVISDVCERRGYNSEGEFHNHTPVAQIALEFWRQYQYTGDREFLTTRALPFLLEAARFFESLFAREKDGKYHAREGTGYEGWIKLHDCVTELVYARVLFATTLSALMEAGVQEPQASKWREILANLAPLPTVKADKEFIRNGTLQCGWFKGNRAASSRLLAAGFGIEKKQWQTSFLPGEASDSGATALFETINRQEGKPPLPDKFRDDLRSNDGIFPWTENAAVFPSGLVGLAQKGTELFRTTATTVKMFACPGMGWFPLGVTLARLGLAAEARKVVDAWPMYWQYYANGWGHYGPLAVMKCESSLPNRTSHLGVRDAGRATDEERQKHAFSFRMYPFRHMGMEAMSCFAAGLNEILLQSHEGTIRVAPATTKDQKARFTLHAQGGFLVSAEVEKGRPRWIAVESRLGKTCKLQNPWPAAVLYENGRKIGIQSGRTLEFKTAVNRRYLLVPDERTIRNWRTVAISYAPNKNVKTHSSGYAALGLPRMF